MEISINESIKLEVSNDIIKELIIKPSSDWSYEFSFDRFIPNDFDVRSTIMNLFSGVSECNNLDIIDPTITEIEYHMCLFRFINMYVFPTNDRVIKYINGILLKLRRVIKKEFVDMSKRHELLNYGPWHIRKYDADKQFNKTYDQHAMRLIRSLNIEDILTVDKEHKLFIPTVGTGVYEKHNRVYCDTHYADNNENDNQCHAVYGIIRKFQSLRGKIKGYHIGPNFKEYAKMFGIDDYIISIISSDLDVDYSVEMFMRLLANQYTAERQIVSCWKSDLYKVYTHWARINPTDEEMQIIRKTIITLYNEYNENWLIKMNTIKRLDFLKH